MNWDGYPKNKGYTAYHVVASKLGRNMTVYKWVHDLEVWVHDETQEVILPHVMANLQYIGEVK